MTLKFDLHTSAASLPTGIQEFNTHCFLDRNWMTGFERYSGIDMIPCHHVMQEEGKPIAFLPGYIQKKCQCGTVGDRLFGRYSTLPFLKTLGTRKAFACTAPWGFHSDIASDGKDAGPVYDRFIGYVEVIAKEHRLSLSGFPYVEASSFALRRHLEANGYQAIPTCPTTFIDVNWDSFEDYVSSLESKKTRRDIRRTRRNREQLTVDWYTGDHLDLVDAGSTLDQTLMKLHNYTWEKHNGSSSGLDPHFLKHIWEHDKPNLRLCIARYGSRIVSFYLMRVMDGCAHAFMMGRDYTFEIDLSTYLSVAYDESIIRGIAEGWKRIYFRPGTYYPKVKRGCQIEPLYLYVKGHTFISRILLNRYVPIARAYFDKKYSYENIMKK